MFLGPINVIAPWITILIPLGIIDYDKVKAEEFIFIHVVIMFFYGLIFAEKRRLEVDPFSSCF